jgi:hypothetical protein
VDRDRWRVALAQVTAEGPEQPRRICALCVGALGMSGGGISMVTTQGNRGVVCATDEVSAQVEQLQFTLGEGPCVDAISSDAPVLVPDLSDQAGLATERWPAFLDAAAGAGVRALFAFPLSVGGIRLGAMDLYRDRPGELGPGELAAALMAADTAAVALLHLATDTGEHFLTDVPGGGGYQFQVHQATGMVMAQLRVPIEEALVRLRARAYAAGRPLQDIAADVVERRIRFTPEDA